MLTPQEITDKVFVKAVFGGYDMTGVDDFLEVLSADYTSLYKENAILKGKLKVLVEKVEEYRPTEDAMRMALLTAQRMGEEITIEANKQKEVTIRNAELEAKSRLSETARRIADEELRLNVAAKETAKFIELSQAIMRKHSEFLTKLETARRTVRPDIQTVQEQQPAPQPSREEQIAGVADEIDSAMEKLTGVSSAQPAYVQANAADTHAGDPNDGYTRAYTISSSEEEASSPRPKFDFDDLKFGSNFDID